jgi:hypothetical protein
MVKMHLLYFAIVDSKYLKQCGMFNIDVSAGHPNCTYWCSIPGFPKFSPWENSHDTYIWVGYVVLSIDYAPKEALHCSMSSFLEGKWLLVLKNSRGKPTRALVPWRQGFRHPVRNECIGWFAQISKKWLLLFSLVLRNGWEEQISTKHIWCLVSLVICNYTMLYIFTINVFFYTYQVHMILFYSVQTIGLTIVDKIEDMH